MDEKKKCLHEKDVLLIFILTLKFFFSSLVAVSGKTAKKGIKDLKLRCKHVAVLCGAICDLDLIIWRAGMGSVS